MKPHGFTGFSKHLDRFHVDEMRAQANRDRLNGEDFVDDFEQMRQEERPVTRIPDAGLRNDDFVNEFHHQQRGGFDHELDDAFDAYLERGVAGPLPPDAQHMEDLYQKAMLHVTSAYPTMGREQIKMKAEQMLHDLHLDRHPMEQAWADDFHHQHQGWHGEFMRRKHAEPVERWVEEMEQKRFEDAYEGRLNRDPHWVEQYNDEEFAGLDKAYEAQAEADEWADEFSRDLKKDEEDDGWFDEFLEKENELKEDSLKEISARLGAIDDPKLQNSQFMSFVRGFAENKGKHPKEWKESGWADEYERLTSLHGHDSTWADQFREMQRGNMSNSNNEYVDEFMEAERDYYNDAYFEGEYEPSNMYSQDENYVFAEDNPYLNSANPKEKGLQFFSDGRFGEAVLALEAAVTKEPRDGEAWHVLGRAHQEGDKDWQAIAALQKATECDPSNLLGLVDQAVSYTNNMQKDKAMASLEAWLRNNKRYKQFAPPPLALNEKDDITVQLRMMYERQDVLIDCFVEAAQTSPQDVDPDVQICLGLLYSLTLEYDNAAECFRAAVSKKKDDYALWNKLGATLANGGHSQAALDAYFEALERKPLYVRARANLGISFLAMKMFVDAAKQFLTALSIEPGATHIWSSLETSFQYMEREDLVEKCKSRNVELFRNDFDF